MLQIRSLKVFAQICYCCDLQVFFSEKHQLRKSFIIIIKIIVGLYRSSVFRRPPEREREGQFWPLASGIFNTNHHNDFDDHQHHHAVLVWVYAVCNTYMYYVYLVGLGENDYNFSISYLDACIQIWNWILKQVWGHLHFQIWTFTCWPFCLLKSAQKKQNEWKSPRKDPLKNEII